MCKKHRKPPEQYAQKPKVVQVSVSTDLSILWNGQRSGLVEHGGMKFRVADKAIKGRNIMAITVFSAPAGTLLRGFDKKDVYLSLKQVQAGEFFSSLEKGSERRKDCETLWNYLHEAFVVSKLKAVRQKRAEGEAPTTSSDVCDFIASKPGRYSFERKGEPKAVFELYTDVYTPQGKTTPRTSVIVKVIAIEKGHALFGRVRLGTFVHHYRLFSLDTIPDFKGERAGDTEKMWEYLTGLIAKNLGEAQMEAFDPQNGGTVIAPQFGRGLAPAMESQTS